jgi:RimJ/RimL family protein N-acetyltransferase
VALLPDLLPAGPIELRRWHPARLDQVMAAVAVSLPELQRWMPWARTMPSAEAELEALRAGEASFEADREWGYLLHEVASGEVVGGAGLHPRVGPGGIEIGYWVRSDRTGRGYATAATRALVEAAFTHLPDVDRIEIHVDVANRASAAIPSNLGFRLLRREDRRILTKSHTEHVLVWVLDRPKAVESDRWSDTASKGAGGPTR